MSNDTNLVRWGIEYTLRKFTPKNVAPTVKESPIYGCFIIDLGIDKIPPATVDGARFYRYLKSSKASWDELISLIKRKSTQPQQQQFNL